MKKIILVLVVLCLLASACTNKNNNINENDKTNQNTENEVIDRSEYLTGEIITDGIYDYPTNGFGIIYFVPDEESGKIIKEKFNLSSESLQLKYDDMEKVAELPKELGIYKVKVSMDLDGNINWLTLKDIQLTDKIGTVLYQGKSYETNELDENVKVKDKVCGLIVKWIDRSKTDGGIQIRFAGEIESEGYYYINNSEINDANIGRIYFDEKCFNNIPYYKEKGFNNFYFTKTNESFDELKSFSAFGRGKFKTSNYILVYNIGMGRGPSDYLTEIISLDEDYKNMFEFEKYKYLGPNGNSKDFIIVSSANYDENSNENQVSTDYYYINKNNPEKLLLFSPGSYNYNLKLAANENEFILQTDGYNYITGEKVQEHAMICKLTESGVEANKFEGLSIDLENTDDNGQKFNMQGYIADIKINENKVIMSLKDVKMREQDSKAFGKTLNENDLVDILIIDYNNSGPFIEVGDKVAVSCGYTKDEKTLYSFGADIGLRN